ncbi:ectoine/hydroxyectoine ABC transporter ATP-binding protein EhuA (plasmid) [Arthrobacter sp. UC242_113]|uniref:ectoine/hydroxyectoine ABC transporter ATP-binding protein EhuA n=1 Tax=Arthrobacter sp. UC242_113 TaxID=3374550 RepID=UPI003756C921
MQDNDSPTVERLVKSDLVLDIQGLTKSYGQNTILNNFSLEVKRGEKVSLIGPSGSGKTTVLRILMTLVKPDSGLILVNGEPLWHEQRNGELVEASPKHLRNMRNGIGMVFQQFNLFPHMTALENVTEALVQVKGLNKEAARERARTVLDWVGMLHKEDSRPWQLSGGQQQRVAIARAIALEPEVMLFDEVTSALDPELVGEVLSVLRDLAATTDITMLLVTHEMRFAGDIADQVVMFDHGRVIEKGTPDQVLRNPREERTRSFLRAILDV